MILVTTTAHRRISKEGTVSEDFATYIASERERIANERRGWLDQRKQIDARLRHHCRESLQELARFEQDGAGAIAPRPAQPQEDLALRGQLERLLSDGRPQHIPDEVFESLAIPRRHGHGGMEIEAFDVGVATGRLR